MSSQKRLEAPYGTPRIWGDFQGLLQRMPLSNLSRLPTLWSNRLGGPIPLYQPSHPSSGLQRCSLDNTRYSLTLASPEPTFGTTSARKAHIDRVADVHGGRVGIVQLQDNRIRLLLSKAAKLKTIPQKSVLGVI